MNRKPDKKQSAPSQTIGYAVAALVILLVTILWSARYSQSMDPESAPDTVLLESQARTIRTLTRIGFIASLFLAIMALAKTIFGWYRAKARFTISMVLCLFYFILFAYYLLQY